MNTDVTSQLKALWKQVFGDTEESIEAFFDTGFSPDRCRYILEGGKVVSALYWLDAQWQGKKLAYIYAVATDPAFRGQGLASRLLTDTHADLKEAGYAGAVLKPAEGLFPFYERLGYRLCGCVRLFLAEAGGVPASMKQCSWQDYGAARRQFLPGSAIIQEGDTLRFLSRWARFYQGENFLLCAGREGDHLYVQEFLGDPEAAPGILAALGVAKAQFRMPGDEVPFAMYLPLTKDCEDMPGYLGLALD